MTSEHIDQKSAPLDQTTPMLELSVVIGTYNQRTQLLKVLEGFNAQTQAKAFEVIIVDSESTDGTDQALKNITTPYKLRHIIQKNSGKAGARNRGIQEANAPIILITDADMIPHPQLIETHIQAHRRHHGLACFEGKTLNMHVLEWPTTESNLEPYIKENLKPNSKLGWWYFLTGNISIPKSVLEDAQGFDMAFQGYGWEDLELGYRLSKKKIPLYYLPSAKNYHYHVITKDEEIQRNYHKGVSAALFLKKHPRLKWFLGLNPISHFFAKRLQENGAVYQWVKRVLYHSKYPQLKAIGFWYLKEHTYLRGIISEWKK